MVRFNDRMHAGEALLAALQRRHTQVDLALAIPRGGLAVAAPVARALGVPLDVLVARKIGVPTQPELAMGAATRFGAVWNEDVVRMSGVSRAERERAAEASLAEIREREAAFRHVRPPEHVEGRRVLVIDDGLATGATAAAAVQALQAAGAARIIVAVPVASRDAVARLEALGAEVVVLHTPADFWAVGQFYADFRPVADDEAVRLLAEASSETVPPPGAPR